MKRREVTARRFNVQCLFVDVYHIPCGALLAERRHGFHIGTIHLRSVLVISGSSRHYRPMIDTPYLSSNCHLYHESAATSLAQECHD